MPPTSNKLRHHIDRALLKVQETLSKKIELALQEDGFTQESIYHSRHEWRNAAFCTDTRASFIKEGGIRYSMNTHANDIRSSLNYKRIMTGIQCGTIFLKKNNDGLLY